MAADSEEIEVICPDVENLTQVETNITCPVDGCTKILPNSSALRMHLVKTHKTTATEDNVFDRGVSLCQNKVKKKIVYCCPVSSCVRGQDSGRYFHRLAHVKQHYMNVHGEKRFTCKKCDKTFGRNDVCLRHEKTCGMIFPCSCGVEFNSRTSMLTHARRNGHIVPLFASNERNERHLKQMNRKLPGNVPNQAICISFVPHDSKSVSTAVRPLKPKKIFSDVETQTIQPCCSHNKVSSLMPNDKVCSVNERLLTYNESLLTQNYKSCPINKSMSLMENNECSANDGSLLVPQDECCSTNEDLLLMQKDKGVMVGMQLERPNIDVLCKHTQAGFDENFDFTIDNEDFKELAHSQTQTNWGLAFDNFPLFEDNETQTLDSYLELDSSTIDCATQTILDEIFSVDHETQTLLPSIDFDDNFGSIHCGNIMDGQTQTLPWTNFTGDETLDILNASSMDCQTQTLPWTNFTGAETFDILNASTNSSMDGQTQTLPWTNFGASFNILQGSPGSNVDEQTQTLLSTNFADSDRTTAPDILQASTNSSMDGQTQTNFIGTETTTLAILQASTSNVETQTVCNVKEI